MTKITVAQKAGRDSTITVRKEETTDFMGRPVITLYFESDNLLDTGSGRAWECNKAIEDYSRERGFRVPTVDIIRYTAKAVYDKRTHSAVLTSKIERRVKADPRFTAAVELAREQAAEINQKYGPVIAQLNHLVFQLGKAQDAELEKVRNFIKAMQSQLVTEMDIPAEVSDDDRQRRLLDPVRPLVKIEQQRLCSKRLPDLTEVARLMAAE